MRLKLLIFFMSLCLVHSYGQSLKSSNQFRLPPDVKLKNKITKIVNLSYKIDKGEIPSDYENIKNSYDKRFDLENIEKYKSNAEMYAYLKQASSFFERIPSKYRELYNDMELWYIYIYDDKLANRLIQ